MWITTVIHRGGLSSGGPDWTCQPAPGGKDSCCSPVFPGTRPTRRQREAPNVTYSCSQTIPLQESGQTQTGSGPTKVGGREDGAVSPKATERIPGQLLVSEDFPPEPHFANKDEKPSKKLCFSSPARCGRVWEWNLVQQGERKVFDELLEGGETV